jgi:L-serine/L-threonine ammonia-lyase
METHGAACFYHSVAANRGRAVPADVRVEDDAAHSVKIAHLPAITSRAQSLGASSPAAGVLAHALRRPGSISCAAVPDEMAMAVAVALAGARCASRTLPRR